MIDDDPDATARTPSPVAALAYAGPDVRPPGAVGSRMAKPVGWSLITAATIDAAFTLLTNGVPTGVPCGLELLAAAAWFVIGSAWLCRAFATAVATARLPVGGGENRQSWWRWAVVPVLFVVTFGVCFEDVPTAVAFRLSRAAMGRSAVKALAQSGSTPTPMDVGLFGTSTPEVDRGTVYFPVAGKGFFDLDTDGYAYNAAGPPLPGHGRCWHLSGPWYRWHLKF